MMGKEQPSRLLNIPHRYLESELTEPATPTNQITLPSEFETIVNRQSGLFGFRERLAKKEESADILARGEAAFKEKTEVPKSKFLKVNRVRKTKQSGLVKVEYDELGEPIWSDVDVVARPETKPFEWEVKTEWEESPSKFTKKPERGQMVKTETGESKTEGGSLELVSKEEPSLFGRKVRLIEEEEYTAGNKLFRERGGGFRLGPALGLGIGGASILMGKSFTNSVNFGEIGLERARDVLGIKERPNPGIDISERPFINIGEKPSELNLLDVGPFEGEVLDAGVRENIGGGETPKLDTLTTTTETEPPTMGKYPPKKTRRVPKPKPGEEEEKAGSKKRKREKGDKGEVRKFILMPKADLLSMTITEAKLKGGKALQPAPTKRNIRLYSREMKVRGTLMRFPTYQMQVWAKERRVRSRRSRKKSRGNKKRRR